MDGAELDEVLKNLNSRRENNPNYKRVFGSKYIALRRATEAKLRKLFEERGGTPERKAPHYFVLGSCEWFAELYPDTAQIGLDWRELPLDQTSVTYPDSFVSMQLGPEFGMPVISAQPYHNQVFRLDELVELVNKFGLPDGSKDADYRGYETREFEKYIEIQLWSDGPLNK